jgi:hypothetical protein
MENQIYNKLFDKKTVNEEKVNSTYFSVTIRYFFLNHFL